jgi:hypothetical protein
MRSFPALMPPPYRKEFKTMPRTSVPPAIGVPAKNKPGQWVQTERKAHEAWANLIARKPSAAMLLHHLVAQMGHQNAVVVPQKVLAKLMGRSIDTVQRAIRDLEAERWIQVVKMNGPGTVAAYVVNDRVAWGQPRDQLRLSVFSAAVVADADDQDPLTLEHSDLRRIPTLYPGERQLPTGPGEDPPSQPNIDGLEPNLPAIQAGDAADRADLEAKGQGRLIE